MSFNSYLPDQVSKKDLHQLILGSVSPRPIALVSSIGKMDVSNLAPFSFFNAISSNPPLLVFSVNVAPGEKPEKDTLKNIRESNQCVINFVNHAILRQMTLCSINYEYGTSEFKKSGLTPIPSDIVKAFRVKESPVQFECTIVDILVFGKHAGASNLIICKIEKIHIMNTVLLDGKLRIDAGALDIIGRLGRSQYVRVIEDVVLDVYQSVKPNCIGYDALPDGIRMSNVLSGNDVAELASCERLFSDEEIGAFINTNKFNLDNQKNIYHQKAKDLIAEKNKNDALLYAMLPEYLNIN